MQRLERQMLIEIMPEHGRLMLSQYLQIRIGLVKHGSSPCAIATEGLFSSGIFEQGKDAYEIAPDTLL